MRTLLPSHITTMLHKTNVGRNHINKLGAMLARAHGDTPAERIEDISGLGLKEATQEFLEDLAEMVMRKFLPGDEVIIVEKCGDAQKGDKGYIKDSHVSKDRRERDYLSYTIEWTEGRKAGWCVVLPEECIELDKEK